MLWSGVGGQLLSYHLLWSGVGGQLLSYHSHHLLWSGVGGQLLSYHSHHLLWSGVGGQLLSYHLLWSGVGGQLLSYHVGGLYCMSSLEGPFRGAFGKNHTLQNVVFSWFAHTGLYVTPVEARKEEKTKKPHFVKRGFFVVWPYRPLCHPCGSKEGGKKPQKNTVASMSPLWKQGRRKKRKNHTL